MVVCSCNYLTDGMIEAFIKSAQDTCKARDVYCGLNCCERCGQCAQTIKAMIAAHDVRGRKSLCANSEGYAGVCESMV